MQIKEGDFEVTVNINNEGQIIMASASPRRAELIKLISENARSLEADIDESFEPLADAETNAVSNACKKAFYVRDALPNSSDIIIGADTLVALGERIMGKPENEEHAFELLSLLSGKEHEVYTGVCIVKGDRSLSFCERTCVEFLPIDENEIKKYIETNEVLDKAGAYGIQQAARLFIKRINGNYENVMGLPVARLYKILKEQFSFIR